MEYTDFGRTGLRVSKLGLGGAPIGGDFGAADEKEIERVIHESLDLGINFMDTAPLYGMGKSEERIGKALIGGKREQVVLASKAVRRDLSYDFNSTISSVEGSLKRLRTDRIDLLQIHDVENQAYDTIIDETLPAIHKLKQEGKVRFIGVTTRDLSLLKRYMETGLFDSIQFYARYMLIDHSASQEILPLARKLGIAVINGSVLGMGILADAPASFLNEDILTNAAKRMDELAFLRQSEPKGLIEPAMRFSLENPDIHVSLTGTASMKSLRANASYCDGIGLDPEQHTCVMDLFRNAPPLFP
ncbi:aldo/keto reductase [Paenibacillus psychroresistens]|uniref:Aldo/keto reductase n=1 Tax=Paenibacillus psychroresistens TaxID=1778678 RepID=A0A6B8RHF4_9BACL|nr:aldo/keto reductase [Paenibacillus psychroresistens]QGQ95025.1 aldo/keto reductase [Paenibacillus psychroresistens]